MATQQSVGVASLGGPPILGPLETPSGLRTGAIAGPSIAPSKPTTQRIRPGILSRQASEREDPEHANHLQSASEDDDATRQSDSGSLPRRFPTEPNSAASSIRNARSTQSPSPLSANFGSRSIYSGGERGGEASASSSRSHLPLQSRTSLYSRQADHDGTRAGDWSEDGASGRGGITFGSDSLSRAKSVSSVSSVNSTSSMEAVPFRAAPLGNVRVGYTGYGGRRNGAARANAIAQANESSDSTPPRPSNVDIQPSPTSTLQASSASPGAGKQRILPKDPSDEWHYRNPPGMGTKSGARNALGTYQTISSPQNIDRRSLSAEDGSGSADIAASPTSTLQGSRIKPSIRSKLAKRAGKLGLKPLTAVAADYSSSPTNSLLQNMEQSIPSQVVETRDPNNGSPAGSVTLPAISLSSASVISSDGSSRGSKSYFASSSFPASPLGLSTDGDQPKLKTSSVTYAPLVVPKHPPGPPGSGPPPSPGLTGAPSPYHPFALASPLISPQSLADEIDPLTMDKDLKVPEATSSMTRSYDAEPKKSKRGSGNGLLGNARTGDTNQRHSLPAPARAPSPRRPSTSPTSIITPAQQIQKDVQAGIARAPAEPSGSNPGSNPPVEQALKKEAEGVAVATRLHAYSSRVESDFLFGDVLGEGSYSTVLEAWDLKPLREKGVAIGSNTKSSSNLMGAMVGKRITAKQRSEVELAKMYAIKVLDKVHILKEKKQKYVGVEREALSLLIRHPGVITLYWTFHDRDNLYFIMELATNGELLNHIKKLGSFDVECTRYYSAQLIETIEGMHQAGVLHRDLKPENILLDSEMRIKVADFGSAKLFKKEERKALSADDGSSSVPSERARTSSFVGTAEYVSPELLAEKQVSEASDWWAFGCLLFQMLCGRPPFKGASEYQTFQKIMKREFEYPPGLPADAKALLDGILVLDADQRFTYKDIREHAFFNGYDWENLWKCKAPELKVGIYQRPATSTASMIVAPKWEDGLDSLRSRDTNVASMSEEDGSKSVQESMNSMVLSDEQPLGQMAKDEWEVQDADDDDSSFSESISPSAPRRRGLSVGASAQERRLSLGSGNGKKAGDFLRMAAGIVSSDSKYESSKLGANGDLRSTALPTSTSQSMNGSSTKQTSNNRSSGSSLLPSTEANKTTRGGMTHNRVASGSTQAQSLLATSWAALLLPNESLLYSCPILHKTTGALLRSGTKKRQLLLTDFPRLLCVKETNNQLRVKSEVILGLPQLASMPLINHSWNAEDEDDDDDEEDMREAYTASQMRRQSSAGPSLASPSRATAADSSHYHHRGIERRDSYPIIPRQQSLTTTQSTTSSNNVVNNINYITNNNNGNNLVQYNSNTTMTNNSLNNTMNRLPGLTSSTTSSTMASTMDTSPNFMTSIEQKSTRTFIVTTPAKSFLYEDPSGDATHWVKSILLAAAANRGADTTMS